MKRYEVELNFKKMHGLGNDFVMIDNMDRSIELSADQVRSICDRHFGIGADGVILVEPSNTGDDGFMNYINSDGSFAQMCGNGVRCFAKFLVDSGYIDTDSKSVAASTRAGTKNIVITRDENGRMVEAVVDMGAPELDPVKVPIRAVANAVADDDTPFVGELSVPSLWGDFSFTAVSMGNPHAVCFLDDIEAIDDALFADPSNKTLDSLNLNLIGAFYESNEIFPEKTNVEFAVVGDDSISMRVYERGCGETLACGTGACATGVAACLTKRAGRKNEIILKGGMLDIDWRDDGHVHMTGPAAHSFSGTISLDDLA